MRYDSGARDAGHGGASGLLYANTIEYSASVTVSAGAYGILWVAPVWLCVPSSSQSPVPGLPLCLNAGET